MTVSTTNAGVRALMGYYAATAGFVALDFGLGLNVRLSFLAAYPGWRVAYYLVCLGCLALMIRRPSWTVAVTAVESLVTMTALILSTALRAMLLDGSVRPPGVEELLNFLISGFAAYFSWTRSMSALFGKD